MIKMELIHVLEWDLEVDPTATAQAHALRMQGSPEECGCLWCRNFASARHLAYPEYFLQFLARLGVSPGRESEVYHVREIEPGAHNYEGWFHSVGRLMNNPGLVYFGPDGTLSKGDPTSAHFSIWFNPSNSLVPESFPSQNVMQIEFSTIVPWVLEEKPGTK